MQNPASFYKEQLELNQVASKRIFKQLSLYSLLRLAIFVLSGIGIYFTYENWKIAAGIAVLGISSFLFLLARYTDLKSKRNLHKRLIAINEEELKIEKGDFHDRLEGSEFQDPKHFFSLDIDLFGKGSFFQFMNRTALKEGAQKLSANLLSNAITNIKERQDAIKELADLPKWRQNYVAVAQGVEIEHSAASIISWLKDYNPFLGKTQLALTIGFSIVSLVILGLGIAEIIPVTSIGYWLLVGLGITGIYWKKIDTVAHHTGRAKDTFRQYALLLEAIETTTFNSELLKEKQKLIRSEDQKASEIFSKFSKALDALDNRNNLISLVLGNGYLLLDIRNSYNVEKWISKYGHKVDDSKG